eukprot:TRINITY_DN480_c0_g2_i1.p1 TRINITY_DN480_c0_g2~~TRINITY_DN480_c0_g2_i1.p1  ORF type:complete len:117 (+),score=4.63 TRINITY_DN480_c0_g2_i1:248-598(+)
MATFLKKGIPFLYKLCVVNARRCITLAASSMAQSSIPHAVGPHSVFDLGSSKLFGTVGVSGCNDLSGWDEGVATMKRGERALFVLAPEFGYGEDGAGDSIPPNAPLVFDIEMLGFQ